MIRSLNKSLLEYTSATRKSLLENPTNIKCLKKMLRNIWEMWVLSRNYILMDAKDIEPHMEIRSENCILKGAE